VDATFAIYADLEEWFTARGRPACWYLAHHGATIVGGLECFASEPNSPPDVAQKQAECLASRLGSVGVVIPEGLWNRRVVRLLWLPTPQQLEEVATESISEEGVQQ
jgi:hypothetical protein